MKRGKISKFIFLAAGKKMPFQVKPSNSNKYKTAGCLGDLQHCCHCYETHGQQTVYVVRGIYNASPAVKCSDQTIENAVFQIRVYCMWRLAYTDPSASSNTSVWCVRRQPSTSNYL